MMKTPDEAPLPTIPGSCIRAMLKGREARIENLYLDGGEWEGVQDYYSADSIAKWEPLYTEEEWAEQNPPPPDAETHTKVPNELLAQLKRDLAQSDSPTYDAYLTHKFLDAVDKDN